VKSQPFGPVLPVVGIVEIAYILCTLYFFDASFFQVLITGFCHVTQEYNLLNHFYLVDSALPGHTLNALKYLDKERGKVEVVLVLN
jgi:hypothetical protein